MVFATGMATVPALGMEPEASLAFRHDEHVQGNEASKGFPYANTCANLLMLPLL
jgi:hypothetical protein